MSETVRVRFAPSPTGSLHLGNVRTALYNWLYARHTQGVFILRVEDTDKERSSEAHCEELMEIMTWLGLKWDEGPRVGGPYAPYKQSERTSIYEEHLQRLKDKGMVYSCYCTEEELELERKRQLGRGHMPKYGGKCKKLTAEERKKLDAEGKPSVLRFIVPPGEILVQDEVRGEVRFPDDQIGDFVLTRSDKSPTYNFTVVVDDALMKVTHVVRGEDHLSNTPKQILLYQALGYVPPKFAHLSIIKGPDGQKLSKRHGETSVESYKAKGYRPDAFLNYLALLGWAPKSGEILTLDQMAAEFDLTHVGKSGAIFDQQKLHWMGQQYLNHVPLDDLTRSLLPYLTDAQYITRDQARTKFDWLKGVVDTVRKGLGCLSDIVKETFFFFSDELSYSHEQTEEMKAQKPLLEAYHQAFAAISDFNGDNFGKAVKEVGAKSGVKGKALYHPLRLALTGREDGPELVKIGPLLGKDEVLKRLRVWTGEKVG
ncbi:MAG TPA: glutamate--tRNA ligase [bacterium]|nr:glutamate--tRNA ligase [bacterium]